MVCPHAGQQRGTIIYCNLARRKVSSLRYPCKGNFQLCPIYRAHVREVQVRREARVEVETPQPMAAREDATLVEAREAQPVTESVERIKATGSALRDTFVGAQLVLRSEPIGRLRVRFEDLPQVLHSLVGDGLAFISGGNNEYRFRCLYANGVVFSIVAEGRGVLLTGSDAIKELRGREFEVRVYKFTLDKLSEDVAAAIKRDIEEALGS